MIEHIQVKHFAIAKHIDLNLAPGLTVLTGETGAGKSIIIDAVLQALGARADYNTIASGQTRCHISLNFDINKTPKALSWLQNNGFDDDETGCLMQRILERNNKSKLRINGISATTTQARELASTLIHIHSQHDHQALLHKQTQRQCLDHYADNEALLNEIKALATTWQQQQRELEQLKQAQQDKNDKEKLLAFHLEELTSIDIDPEKWQALQQQHKTLHHGQTLAQQLDGLQQLLSDNDTAISQQLHQAQQLAIQAKQYHPDVGAVIELLDSAMMQITEAANEASHLQQRLDLSPETLARIEAEVTLIHELARKHHTKPESLNDVKQALMAELDSLKQIDDNIAQLEKAQQETLTSYQEISAKLSASRQKASKTLNTKISAYMQQLGMKGGAFSIDLTAKSGVHADGQEDVQFLVATNPGQALAPMQQVVSGGELSRISLALQVVSAGKNGIATIIFDEVDTGIGGETAQVVANLLKQLSREAQVLCITHLAQIAARADQHLKVEKQHLDSGTENVIYPLNKTDSVKEIARLLSGNASQEAIRHAESLLAE